ncbi:hypothetical protein [Natrinema sp. SYSU A 869]|uniref:hypothetical protein n=1 Tax=Natrinema sp. SYSU A 869 TaxID=2871694 RepID=UPI0021045F3D|nr:hypothetical protein [Natrinema sp. SYSU A 869]
MSRLSRPHPRPIAATTALLGVISLLTAVLYFITIPENPPGSGFAAGLTGLFVMLCILVGTLALIEAGLLFLVTRHWVPAERPRRLLVTGAVAGSLSVILLVIPMLVAWVFEGLVPSFVAYGTGIGLVLVPIGIVCSGLGAILQLVDEVRTDPRA